MEKVKTDVKRINGYLREVVTFMDSSGKPMSQIINPLMIELHPKDIMQIFAGAFLVAAPLCFTEEVWSLSVEINKFNVFGLAFVSFASSALYIYFNFYRFKLRGHVLEMVKRVLAVYVITLSCVILILALINKFPIQDTPYIAIKRVLLIGFPAMFGAIISDNIK